MLRLQISGFEPSPVVIGFDLCVLDRMTFAVRLYFLRFLLGAGVFFFAMW
jgi:hypothetical protein